MKNLTRFYEHLNKRCYVSKKQLLILMTLCLSLIGYAQTVGDTFVDNFITYEVTSVMPNEVEAIGYDISGGTVVNIPATVLNNTQNYNVESIGDDAFKNKQINALTITPNGVITIGENAFQNNQLTSVVIPNGVTTIGRLAFSNNQIISIDLADSVTVIDYAVFDQNNVSDIANVVFPIGLTEIPAGFLYANQLTTLTIPTTFASIGDEAFAENQLTSVTFHNNITSIGAYAFGDNQIAGSLTIPDSVINIGNAAFASNNLTAVVFPNGITAIGEDVFKNNNFTNIIIPDGVVSIGEEAFMNNALTAVNIPNTVNTIGEGAFRNNQLSMVDFGDNVQTIDYGAFRNNQLTSITISESITSMGGYVFGDNPLTSVTSLATTPSSINSGANDTFGGLRSNIDLTIPNGTSAAYVAGGWTGFNSVTEAALSIDDFEIANSVRVITTRDAINIISDNSLTLQNYMLFSISGQEVATGKESNISTITFANGIYILKLNFDRGTVIKKVIIN